MSTPATTRAPETVVSRWVDAFNDRDLNAMLACLAVDVEFHPLRLHRLDGSYQGHDGVRSWFAQLERLQHEQRLKVSRIESTDGDQVLAVGAVSLNGLDVGPPFCGLYVLADGLILAAHLYLTEPQLLKQLGRLS